jgi:hypothetical protein
MTDALRRASGEASFFHSVAGQLALLGASVRTLVWVPAAGLTTAGLLAAFFCLYVGSRIGPLATAAGLSLGVAVALWAFGAAAVVSALLLDTRFRRANPKPGFGTVLRQLLERRTGVMRRLAFWCFTAVGGLWLCGVAVSLFSVVGLTGPLGKTVMAALLGAQVLIVISGFAWMLIACAVVIAQPALACTADKAHRGRLFDGWRLWGAQPVLRSMLTALTVAVLGLLFVGGLALESGYTLVLHINQSVAGPSLREILSATPLAPYLGLPLAAEPALSQQTAGLLATVSLAAVSGLLLGLTAVHWGAAGLALASHPALARALENSRKPSAHSKKVTSSDRDGAVDRDSASASDST